MRKHRWLRLVAVASVLALALAACGGDDDDDNASGSTSSTAATAADRGNVDGTLAIGALLPQSGDLAVIFNALHTPVTMAIDEINAAGGVNGKPVVAEGRRRRHQSPTSPPSALDTLLTSDKVDAIVGPASSTTTDGIVDKVASNGVVDVLGFEHLGRAQPTAKDGGYYFRTAPPDKSPGPGARAAHPRRQQVEGRDPRPERLLRHRFRPTRWRGAHRRRRRRSSTNVAVRPGRVRLQRRRRQGRRQGRPTRSSSSASTTTAARS